MSQSEPSSVPASSVQFATEDGCIQCGDWVRFVQPAVEKKSHSRVIVGVVLYVLPDKGGGWQDIVTDAGTVSDRDVLEVRRSPGTPVPTKRKGARA